MVTKIEKVMTVSRMIRIRTKAPNRINMGSQANGTKTETSKLTFFGVAGFHFSIISLIEFYTSSYH